MSDKKKKGSVFDMLAEVAAAEGNAPTALSIAIEDIEADPEQPRKTFDPVKLENLAKSIEKLGVIQPITVRKSGAASPLYFVVAGERRLRASKIAGKTEIPAFLRDDLADDSELLSIAQLAENMNRVDLSDYEAAKKIQQLIDLSPNPTKHGLKTEIAEFLDRPRPEISRLLKMLEVENVALVEEGLIVSADALSRFRACDAELQAKLLEEARASGEPITGGMVRAAKAAQKAIAENSAAPAAVAANSTAPADKQVTNPAGAQGGDVGQIQAGTDGDDAGQIATGTDGGDAGQIPAGAEGDDAGQIPVGAEGDDAGQIPVGAEGDDAGQVPSGTDGGDAGQMVGGEADEDEDEDEDEDDGGHGNGGFAGDRTGGAGSGTTTSVGAPRLKAVSLQVTGEFVETLLRYLVDKSSDKLEVRLNNDLAIGVIENLGGQVPENPEHFAQTIKDLLAQRMQ
ncbi:ParB/RepB/Spo0J family partition protein [Stenotrophomonas maltophilia]|uniref:ParB/RepB/Spo0J family partition protein n=1 Tax=Stenotrophomonas maltophilia TaxID=40324 RepID=UPI002447E339|nr:ParB/RepB/Spo0J family partition protein [Stenotrophomonas maltophilia]MDH0074136.1 ParB/RepB/Spo0J family partition protein [Stenotrophomonas maltophilia]MDH0333616.1 ParB/RepB/Spo0J family partition protein [Stenotrophomonas maltophilia]